MISALPSLSEVLCLYDRGLYLQAYAAARPLGPLADWEGTEARLLAGRLAAQLGGKRLSYRLMRSAWRDDPTHPEARYFRARNRLEKSGPLAAWELLRREGDMREAPPELRGPWLALCATVAAHLRDFDAADAWIARAEEMAPGDPWVPVERAAILELEDRYEESLAAARRALEVRPWYRAAVQAVAHGLQLLGRDDEALALLTEAVEQIESAALAGQLTLVQTEMGRWEDARRSLDRFEALTPLIEKESAQWLAGRRSDVAYYCGDVEKAVLYARLADDPFHQEIAKRLSVPGEARAVLLPVGFVRQHHMTCVPATLATITQYWSMPADHLSVAEAICYDGTPDHSERNWAEENGWTTREFTVTWESAVALLDRGVPFTLVTSNPTSAHLQAVIGYDARRGTLLIRDPYHRHFGEFRAEEGLKALAATGPRGMALVPRAEGARLAGLDLPDAALYDQHHRLQRALRQHDRAAAQAIFEALQQESPEHRLTLQARRSLASYDSNHLELLACAERLLERFPDDGALQLLQLYCLRELARRDERIERLKQICAGKECHPVFWQQYAQELIPDAREHGTTLRMLRRALRAQPQEGGNVYLLGRLRWDQRQFAEAARLFRMASCLEEKNESIAQGYFHASRHLKQTEATLQFLQRRFERFGTRSSQPARTLFWALHEIDRTPEAFRVLEEALQRRPDDGDLLLFGALARSRCGEYDRAAALLERAGGKASRSDWLGTAAELARHRGDLKEALALQRQVVEAEPLELEAHRAAAQLIAATESRTAALEYLAAVVERFPHHYRLNQLRIEWLRDEEPEQHEAAIRRLIEINPVDIWARQELALALANQRRFDEALAESELAGRLDPTDAGRWCVHGQVCALAGRMLEARAAYRETIRLSVDIDFAIRALVDACDTPAERREALAFVESELERQTIFGDGLLAFRDRAQSVLAPEELLAALRKAHRARPDLWHAGAAVAAQLVDMDRLDEALSVAKQTAERFPLLPRPWLDLARVHEARADRGAEREALEQALRISPGWGQAVGQLASLYERNGEFEAGRKLLQQAVTRSPLDPLCHGWLAQMLWRLNEKEDALAHVERALELEPGYEWAWSALCRWSGEQEGAEGNRAAAVAHRLAERRPGEARSWLFLARTLSGEAALPERLVALDRAIELSPRLTDAYELKAALLARAGRFDEALAACRPAAWGDAPPADLLARAAGIEAGRGNLRAAIEQMQAVVKDEPHFSRGWAELAGWYDQTGADAEYLEATQKLVALEAQNPRSFGLLADARQRAGDRHGAKAAFRRAFDLAPDYDFAGFSLFDVHLEDGELDAAAAVLERLRTHVGGPGSEPQAWAAVLARDVQLAVARRDQVAATRALRDLCVGPVDESWPYASAAQTIRQAGWGHVLDRVLDEMIDRPDVNPRVAALWVRSRAGRGEWGLEERLAALRARGPVGTEATAAFLELLAENRRLRALRRLLHRQAALLRNETRTWAAGGYALVTIGDYRRAALWLGDWRTRPDVKPAMLLPLAAALRALGRDGEAADVSRQAMTLDAGDGYKACHAIWLAVDAALDGQTEAASDLLSPAVADSLNRYYRYLHALAQSATEVQRAAADARPAAWSRARGRLKAASPRPADLRSPALRRAHRRLLLRLARDVGGPAAALWAGWLIAVAELRARSGS